MANEFRPLDEDEILSIESQFVGKQLNVPCSFEDFQLKGYQLIEIVKKRLSVEQALKDSLFNQGINCEALRFGNQGWEKGKLRIQMTLEFCPDEPLVKEETLSGEPESALNDIHHLMNETDRG